MVSHYDVYIVTIYILLRSEASKEEILEVVRKLTYLLYVHTHTKTTYSYLLNILI